jgi:hypothetical protein
MHYHHENANKPGDKQRMGRGNKHFPGGFAGIDHVLLQQGRRAVHQFTVHFNDQYVAIYSKIRKASPLFLSLAYVDNWLSFQQHESYKGTKELDTGDQAGGGK